MKFKQSKQQWYIAQYHGLIISENIYFDWNIKYSLIIGIL